jgi:hypothetical protein
MSESHQINAKYFKELDLYWLKIFAKRWVEQFPNVPIENIVLYRYRIQTPKLPTKFAVVFKVHLSKSEAELSEDFNKFESTLINLHTMPYDEYRAHALDLSEFDKVYNVKPNDNILKDWQFLILLNGEKSTLPVRGEVPDLILYPDTNDIDDINEEKTKPSPDPQNEENVFRQTGPTWTIIYKGKELSGLKGKGFRYIHFLVSNHGKEYHVNELSKEIDKLDPSVEKYTETDDYLDKDEAENEYKKKMRGKIFIDHRDMINGKSQKAFKDHYDYLKEELKKAEDNNDIDRANQARKELEDYEKILISSISPGGKTRKFVDSTSRNMDRITKSIERAVKAMEDLDEATFRHFKSALTPIRSFYLSYTPISHIDWLTDPL